MQKTSVQTQKAWLINALKAGRKITPVDALNEAGCFRLGARIFDLRKDGFEIETDFNDAPDEPRYAIYRLARGQAAQ